MIKSAFFGRRPEQHNAISARKRQRRDQATASRSAPSPAFVAALVLSLTLSAYGQEALKAVKPSDCMPLVTDYTYMWWPHGWRSAKKVLAFQSGHYGMAIDVRKVRLLHLGTIARPLSVEETVAEDNAVVFSLPEAALKLEVVVDKKTYTCTGSEAPVSRIIESGRFVQRADIGQLVFKDAAGQRLAAQGRLEIIAWPDRLTFMLEVTPAQDHAELAMSIKLTGQADALESTHAASGVSAGQAEANCLALVAARQTRGFRRAPSAHDGSVLAREMRTGEPAAVTYDACRQWYEIARPTKAWYTGPKADRLDRIALRLKNPSKAEQTFRLMLKSSERVPHITGVTPMLRDAEGNPTGIPVQISKNWHRRGDTRILYEGRWLHGFALVRVPAHSVLDCELTITHAWWGGLPAVSHAQLCLIGWGTDQLWNQVAIGSWGENFCYDPDVNLNRGMIDDLRPLMVTSKRGDQQWTWTHNVGGGDFADYHPDGRGRRFMKRMRTYYRQYGPCLTGVTYAGISPDGAFTMRATASSPRCDDIARAYYHVRYDFHKTIAPKRLEIFRLGADSYNDADARKIAYGHGAAMTREFDATGKEGYQTTFPLIGEGSWIALYRSANQPKTGAWANRAIILRAWKARIGGKDNALPAAAVIGTRQGRHASANLVARSNNFEPGDFIEFTVEMVILPLKAEDYYGPNQALRNHLATHGDSWQPVARQAAGNTLDVAVAAGTIERRYPPVVRVSDGQSAGLTVTGGLAQLPVTFTGLADYKGYSLWTVVDGEETRLDQSIHGNDFWQTDYDAATGTWRQTYNVPLDSPSDARRTVILRFRPN